MRNRNTLEFIGLWEILNMEEDIMSTFYFETGTVILYSAKGENKVIEL